MKNSRRDFLKTSAVAGGTLVYGNSAPAANIISPLNTIGTGQNVLIEALFLRLVYGRQWGDGINPDPSQTEFEFAVAEYSRLATPAWVDVLVQRLKDAAEARVRARIAGLRVQTLDQAVRRITQRVNLFEKILIPTAKKNIQRIRIFLGDAERAAVITSKLAMYTTGDYRLTPLTTPQTGDLP